ncbi:unnamed protein product [Caenorhabditis sp. 36 PRJEB53466]|nr:unnamed protein product [Caenorhabditis sp. 36 PRJEB53466]
MELSEWIDYAKNNYNTQKKVKVVGVIGKDSPDHGKGDNINSYLRENVFPVATSEDETCTIRAHYSEEEHILFLVMNGVDDLANVRKCLTNKNNEPINYFEAMSESEAQQIRMLHLLFISCHFILLFEETSRINTEQLRFFRRVNISRMQLRKRVNQKLVSAGLRNVAFNNCKLTQAEAEGRMGIPRLLMAFQRNNIRSDLGSSKKKELYHKLERSLDAQLAEALKTFELSGRGASAFCRLNETLPCVHLLNPDVVKRDIVNEMFETFMAEAEHRPESSQKLPNNNSFDIFLDDNLKSERYEISLENVIKLLDCLSCVLDASLEEGRSAADLNPMTKFIQTLQEDHMREARRLYTHDNTRQPRGMWRMPSDVSPVKTRSKEEHVMRFREATRYIETVVGNNTEEAIAELHAQCDEMWQTDMRACEAVSLMGHQCVKKLHPTFGDFTVSETQWTAHDAANTLLSTCTCGRKQLARLEPFSVKEANCDFFENQEFSCCRRLWRYEFQLYQENTDDKEDVAWDGDRDSNSLHADKKVVKREDESHESQMTESLVDDEGTDEDVSLDKTHSSLSDSEEEMYVRPTDRQLNSSRSERDMAVEYAKKLQRLMAAKKNNDFIEDVPNSLNAGRLPLFPSWFLTSFGDSILYNHSVGLAYQPNFKRGGEYLTPVIVNLDVDRDTWNRDLHKVRNEDSGRKHLSGRVNDDAPRVKLFIGFEYECSRGHRFFVDHVGEPMIYARKTNVHRESAQRSLLGNVLEADLPIRRPCTCRKPPLRSAQLQKIHVVTPKAPVHVTIDPKIVIPGHSGVYGTGQAPVELHHSKYYILQLPTVYSGPSGIWTPPEYLSGKHGTWTGGSIKVLYKPVHSYRW